MSNLDFLHFEQLKNEIQAKYLESHMPSNDNISKWKGIDIVYFQEDLRKFAKGNISEKSFYTYFKTQPLSRLPRIDILNILSIYAGYQSWYEFKKNHLFANEILQDSENIDKEEVPPVDLQKENTTQELEKLDSEELAKNQYSTNIDSRPRSIRTSNLKYYFLVSCILFLALSLGFLIFKDDIFSRKFYYNFIDADRNSKINAELQVQILKDNESPILYTAKPNEPFVYTTKSKRLKMVVSSPFYKSDTIYRNLETAPESENIELLPDNYAQMLFYYTKNIKNLKNKRQRLDRLISDNALIYHIFDNDTYGVETIDKQRYISLVTLPTTSLENLEVIYTKTDADGKINVIKFRIRSNENK